MATMESMDFAAQLEADGIVRNIGRQHGALMQWPDQKTRALGTMKNASVNAHVMHLTARWWVEHSDAPASIPIDTVRNQAGPMANHF